MSQLRELPLTPAERFARRVGLKQCECGPERKPERVVRDGMSFLVCSRCGGRTTDLKTGR